MCDVDQEKIKEIAPLQKIEVRDFKQNVLDNVYHKLSFHPKNSSQEQFFYSLLKYATHRNNPEYVYESVYVSENAIFFEKFLPGGTKLNCLKDFFPNLLLLNLRRLKEVLDYYEKKNGYYYFSHTKLDLKEECYFRTLFSTLPVLQKVFTNYSKCIDIAAKICYICGNLITESQYYDYICNADGFSICQRCDAWCCYEHNIQAGDNSLTSFTFLFCFVILF
jgi:hypothetical protein